MTDRPLQNIDQPTPRRFNAAREYRQPPADRETADSCQEASDCETRSAALSATHQPSYYPFLHACPCGTASQAKALRSARQEMADTNWPSIHKRYRPYRKGNKDWAKTSRQA